MLNYRLYNNRICQPEKSKMNMIFEGLTDTNVNRKRQHQMFCNITLSLFSKFSITYFIFINVLKSDIPSALINCFSSF